MFIGSNVQIESIDVKASVTTHVASLAVFEHELQDLSHLASLALSVSVGEIVDLGSVGKVVADVVACVRVLHAAVADRIRGALGTVATEVECCAYSVLAIACVTLVDRDRLGDVPGDATRLCLARLESHWHGGSAAHDGNGEKLCDVKHVDDDVICDRDNNVVHTEHR